jgi:hypothetical protein
MDYPDFVDDEDNDHRVVCGSPRGRRTTSEFTEDL